jgi:hypothetical protein
MTVQSMQGSQAALLTILAVRSARGCSKLTREGEPYAKQVDEVLSYYHTWQARLFLIIMRQGLKSGRAVFRIAIAQLHIGLKQIEQLVRYQKWTCSRTLRGQPGGGQAG